MKYICFAAVMISLTGCVNSSGVLPMGPDTYSISVPTSYPIDSTSHTVSKIDTHRTASNQCVLVICIVLVHTPWQQDGHGRPVVPIPSILVGDRCCYQCRQNHRRRRQLLDGARNVVVVFPFYSYLQHPPYYRSPMLLLLLLWMVQRMYYYYYK